MAGILPKQKTVITIYFGLNWKVCGLKTATILIQDRWQQFEKAAKNIILLI